MIKPAYKHAGSVSRVMDGTGGKFMTRTDQVGEGSFDSIAWIHETHLKQPDTKEFNYALVYGNEDCPEQIELFRENSIYSEPAVYVLEQ